MKTNLDGLFKNNEAFEKEGIWMDVTDTIAFKVRRFGGFNSQKVKAAVAKYHKPYARQIQNGTLGESKEREINTKVFVEACITDWKGIEIDGIETAFSIDAAIKLLTEMPELADALSNYAMDTKNYKEDLGNS